MGITTYGVSTTDLTGVSSYLPTGLGWNITGYSYTNPNITVTTSTNHSFQVGNRVGLQGIIAAGTTVPGSTTYNITAVTANTFTFNYGATAPSNYVSGGIAKLGESGTIGVSAYLNGRYIFAMNANYVYSVDGINWQMGQLPTNGNQITSMAFDGTTYIFAARTSGLWSSTTLAQGSWTQRSTFGGFHVHDVKWYGGSINRFVAVGSSDTSADGVGGRIETAPAGGTTWTNQTISGTSISNPYRNSAWDGANTICAIGNNGLAVSTSGAGSWTGYSGSATFGADSGSISGAPQMFSTTSCQLILWNPSVSRWMSFFNTSNTFLANTSTTAPTGYWTRTSFQDMLTGKNYTGTDAGGYGNPSSQNMIIMEDGFMYTYRFDSAELTIHKWSQTPVVLDTHSEVYPFITTIKCKNAPSPVRYTNLNATTMANNQYAVQYGGGKWVLLQSGTSRYYPANAIATIFQ